MSSKPSYEELEQRIRELETNHVSRRRIEQALEESEREKTSILDNTPDLIAYFKSPEMKLEWTNKAAVEAIGIPMERLVGNHCYRIWQDRDEPCHDCPVIESFQTGEPGESEKSSPDGRIWLIRSYPVKDEKGSVVGMVELTQNITERKQAQAVLQRRDTILESVSFAAERFLSSISWEENITAILERLGRAAEVSRVYIFENHTGDEGALTSSQLYEWAAPGIEPQIDNPGLQSVPWRARGFGRLEEQMKKGDIICGNVRDFPDSERKLFLQQNIHSLVAVPLFVEKQWWGIIGFDDRRKEREWSATEIDALRTAANTLAAAIHRNRVEASLRASEIAYRSLIENLPIGLYRNTPGPQGRFIMANPALARMHGCESVEEFLETPAADLYINSEERKAFSDMLLADGKTVAQELRLKKRDGSFLWGAVTANVVRDATGRIKYFDGLIEDITQRKRMEKELQEYGEKLEKLVEKRTSALQKVNEQLETEIAGRMRMEEALRESRDRYARAEKIGSLGHWDGDFKENKSVWSRELYRIFGMDPGKADSTFQEFLRIVHPSDRKKLEKNVETAIHQGGILDHEYRIVRPEGTVRFIHSLAEFVMDEDGRPWKSFGMIQDVTERKQMEQELAKVQQMEALGILAGGIAHDFNNILTAIMANLSMARAFGSLDEDVVRMMTDAEAASLRAKNLTQQLLSFAKGGAPIKKPASISELIRHTTEFYLSGSNVKCEHLIPNDLWLVEIDEGQIGQVIQNLVINADQAMPEGGIIKIHAENVTLGEKEHGHLRQGPYVILSFQDQGNGIPQSRLSKIFDPFFSTKEKGRGLGLAIAFSIVNRHEGHIHVESEPGKGATFQVYLPATKKKLLPREREKKKAIRGGGKVLLVDDEAIVRKSVGEILKRLGYEVAVARDGAEGIEIYRKAGESNQPFQAVIMDLTIPGGMGGKEAIQQLKKIDPEARVVVSSGYSDDPVMSDFASYGFSGVVAKPYNMETLGKVLDRVIRGDRE